MVYLIVGGSCSGKTSFVKNKFLNNAKGEMKKDILPYYETENTILIGVYDGNKGRTNGTDRINRKDIPKFAEQIIKFYNENPKKDIVLEGTKIISRPLWNNLILNNIQCKVILIYCSAETSIKRNRINNSTNTDRNLKAVCTASLNIYNEYKDIFNGIIVNSENVKDFSTFGIDFLI